ncbi:serine hydrolase domain-containing protein [Cytobacillus sp. FJAT-54145]|uniref:Serine hydrolase domain-containing protein n=1 Tax=Cytobacillus spartinae TaxID=3299023 RepID=A0ABW6KAQ8_9BACI
MLNKKTSNQFSDVLDHVKRTSNQVNCSGTATLVIHNNSIVLEEYTGKQSKKPDARKVQSDTQFHVASVRKSYIGFAVAYAVYHGYIKSIDDLVVNYLPELEKDIWDGTTIRHLLTHTHGLNVKRNSTYREFPAGTSWSYKQVGIDALTTLVKRVTNKTVADILHEKVFLPLQFSQSGWYAKKHEKLVDVILRYDGDKDWYESESTAGDKMNMYVSARELAMWGYMHLLEGNLKGKQIVEKEIIHMATSIQSPQCLDKDLPQNGFLWFVKELPAKKTEIGERVPVGSFQILGYTGVTLLVIPEESLVAVRMFNSFGSPDGFDYLSDVRSFGDTVVSCLEKVK